MMTTATDKDTSGKPIKNDSGSVANPFGYGAGEVQPKYGMDPGLVYDSTYTDWTTPRRRLKKLRLPSLMKRLS